MKVNVPQPRTGQIAAGIDRLKREQRARTELAQLEPDELREALRLRSDTLGGEGA